MIKLRTTPILILALRLFKNGSAAPMNNQNHDAHLYQYGTHHIEQPSGSMYHLPNEATSYSLPQYPGQEMQMYQGHHDTSPYADHSHVSNQFGEINLELGADPVYPNHIHQDMSSYDYPQHEMNSHYDYGMHFDPSQTMHYDQLGGVPFEHGGSSMQHQHEGFHQESHQGQHQGVMSSDLSNRHPRLREYVWQQNLSEAEVMKVYKTIADLWGKGYRSTNVAKLERLGTYLENNPKQAKQILEHDRGAIKMAIDNTQPRNHSERRIKAIGSPKHKLSDAFQVFKELLEPPRRTRSDAKPKYSQWGPKEMKFETKEALVELLHRVWGMDRAGVEKRLERLEPDEFPHFTARLLSNDPVQIEEATDELNALIDHKKHLNISAAQTRRHSLSKAAESQHPHQDYQDYQHVNEQPTSDHSNQHFDNQSDLPDLPPSFSEDDYMRLYHEQQQHSQQQYHQDPYNHQYDYQMPPGY